MPGVLTFLLQQGWIGSASELNENTNILAFSNEWIPLIDNKLMCVSQFT